MPYDLDTPVSADVPIVQSVQINELRLKQITSVFTPTDVAWTIVISRGVESGGVFTEHQIETFEVSTATTPQFAAELSGAPTEATRADVLEAIAWNTLENAGLIPSGTIV